jgi:hypothetical protein
MPERNAISQSMTQQATAAELDRALRIAETILETSARRNKYFRDFCHVTNYGNQGKLIFLF